MTEQNPGKRRIGLLGAGGIGVGAIVGGGILVLGGIALRQTGPSAVAAFGLNGLIAFLTVLSFAEMSTLFPESGGVYTFAKRILSIRAGFVYGWIVWFAHLVAALMYALGFSIYAIRFIMEISTSLGLDLEPYHGRKSLFALASIAVIGYSILLLRSEDVARLKANVVKLFVFCLLIAGGAYAFISNPDASFSSRMSPFFPTGLSGFFSAMGLTFIALQGFEVIAGVAGEIKEPERTIPRAMFVSLGIALLVYLPMLLVIVLSGVPDGQQVHLWCAERADTCFADAAQNFLGDAGYWLVIAAALFSTLTALQANLLSASRLVQSMAADRTLPRAFAQVHNRYQTPAAAIFVNLLIVLFCLGLISTLDVAGAAASLVFLISYASSHFLSFLARRRAKPTAAMFRTPFFPAAQFIGGTACLCLAVYQGLAEPGAGIIVIVWLGLGAILYRSLYSERAETVDAYFQALRPELLTYRGYTPLVLVPITNPGTAPALVEIAHALAAHEAGKVMLLKVASKSAGSSPELLTEEIAKANEVLTSAIIASTSCAAAPAEALLTLSDSPWREISRVAKHHHCHGLVLGVNRVDITSTEPLINQVSGDIAVLAAPLQWHLPAVRRVLVPVGGRAYHDSLRARVLGTLSRTGLDEVCFVSVLPHDVSPARLRDCEKMLRTHAQDEAGGVGKSLVLRGDSPIAEIINTASEYDLLILGLSRTSQGEIRFGEITATSSREAPCATLIIGRRS